MPSQWAPEGAERWRGKLVDARAVGRDLAGEDREHDEEQQQERAQRLPCGCAAGRATAWRPAAVAGAWTSLGSSAWLQSERLRLNGAGAQSALRSAAEVLVRGSSSAVTMSATSTAEQHRDGDEQEQGLHERVVLAGHGVRAACSPTPG